MHSTVFSSRSFMPAAVLGLGLLAATASQAGEVYVQAGLPGVGLGYAHPLSPSLGLRADFVTLGSHDKTQTESGIAYNGKIDTRRVGVYADWFVFSGSFRLTGGMTSNNYKLALDASGAGGTLTVGNTTYTTTAADGLNIQIEFPKTTPYLGLGFGHQMASGFRFSTDIGASIGRAKVTAVGRGQLAASASQSDIDAELADVREGVGKVRLLPQLSFSVGYSF